MDNLNNGKDLLNFIFFQNKIKFFIYVISAFLFFVLISSTAEKKYMISMKFMESQMVQTQSSSQGIMSSVLGSVGLGGEGTSLNMDKYIEMLHSHALAENLIEDPRVKNFFFPDEYDQTKDEWKRPSGMIPKIKLALNRLVGKVWKEPSAYRLSQELAKEIHIGLTLNSKVNSLFLYSDNIDVGKYILNKIFKQADEIIRVTDEAQFQKYNDYLQESYDNNFMYQLLTRNEQRLMQIKSGSMYIVEQIQPPYSEDYPSKPNYFSIFVLLQILFFFIFLTHIFVSYLLKAR